MYIHVCVCMCVCVCVCACVSLYACMYVCVSLCMYVWLYVHMLVCVRVCVQVWVHVYAYTRAHELTYHLYPFLFLLPLPCPRCVNRYLDRALSPHKRHAPIELSKERHVRLVDRHLTYAHDETFGEHQVLHVRMQGTGDCMCTYMYMVACVCVWVCVRICVRLCGSKAK